MEASGPLGTSNVSPSGQFLSALCLAQRTLAVYFASHCPTQPLGSKITQHCDFPRADYCLHLKGDRPILTHSACPPPTPPHHLWHPGSCLIGWLDSESHKRDCPMAIGPAPEPAWHTQAQSVSFIVGLSGGPAHFPPPCGLPHANPRRLDWPTS